MKLIIDLHGLDYKISIRSPSVIHKWREYSLIKGTRLEYFLRHELLGEASFDNVDIPRDTAWSVYNTSVGRAHVGYINLQNSIGNTMAHISHHHRKWDKGSYQ